MVTNSASTVVGSILTGINNLTSFDENNVVNISYRNNLGALDFSTYTKADNAYLIAKNTYTEYSQREKTDKIDQELEQAINLLNKTKALTDAVKHLFDKSISSSDLPQSSPGGVSLMSLQSQAASFQSQLNTILSQVQGTLQAWQNFNLESKSALESLSQSVALSKKQEDSAAQSLSSLKAGNKSQKDQASFSFSLADNQYENLKVKLNSQVLAAKTQMDSALLQYNNASLSLKILYDSRSIVSPINGKVFQKALSNGDTVNPGQLIAVVGQSDGIKLKFFVESENVSALIIGQEIKAIDSDGREYAGNISSISAQAEPISKRFQVEASLLNLENPPLLGTVLNIHLSFNRSSSVQDNFIFLPLSSIEIGQNGNFIFIIENNKAKKIEVKIDSVLGEVAKLKLDFPEETLIIVAGNKFLSDGQLVNIKDE